MKKAFITLFPDFSNVHFYKDVGMIPHVMSTNHGYDSFIFTSNEGVVPEGIFSTSIKVVHIEPLKGVMGILRCIKVIIEQTKGYDSVIFNTYHYRVNYMVMGLFLRLAIRKCSHYVKFDANSKIVSLMFSNTKWYFRPFRNYLLSKVALFSVESVDAYNYFKNTNYLSKNICLVPNGVRVEDLSQYSENQIIKTKEKIIITASRLESDQKNIRLLIDSYCNSELWKSNWRLLLAGSSDDYTRAYVSSQTKSYNIQDNNIEFVGMLNRQDLFSLMTRAKIFALSSKFEGFSLIIPEAAAHACLIVSTDVSGVSDVTCDGTLGFIAKHTIDDYSKKLRLAATAGDDIAIEQRQHCLKNYDWNIICEHLNGFLNEKSK